MEREGNSVSKLDDGDNSIQGVWYYKVLYLFRRRQNLDFLYGLPGILIVAD